MWSLVGCIGLLRSSALHALFPNGLAALARSSNLWRFQVLAVAAQNLSYGSTMSPGRLAQVREIVQSHMDQHTPDTCSLFQVWLPMIKEQLQVAPSYHVLFSLAVFHAFGSFSFVICAARFALSGRLRAMDMPSR